VSSVLSVSSVPKLFSSLAKGRFDRDQASQLPPKRKPAIEFEPGPTRRHETRNRKKSFSQGQLSPNPSNQI
jgi:hypothetical protein